MRILSWYKQKIIIVLGMFSLVSPGHFDNLYNQHMSLSGNSTLPYKGMLCDLFDNSTQCEKKLCSLVENMASKDQRTKWESEYFLDAAGKPPAGILGGNTIFMGDYDMCQALINHTHTYMNEGNYKFCSTFPLGWSGCLPPECQHVNVTKLTKSLVNLINNITHSNIKAPSYIALMCEEDIGGLDTGAYFGLTSLAIILFLVTAGTLWYATEPVIHSYIENRSLSGDSNLIDNDKEDNNDDKKTAKNAQYHVVPDSTFNKFVKCFSLQRTFGALFSTDTKPGQVLCLNGIRVLSINWVVLCHFYAFGQSFAGDKEYFINIFERVSFGVVLNGFASVDSFFVMSGFLVSYLLLKQINKRGELSPLQWLAYYLHRYLRLTIPFLIVILVQAFLYRHWVSGPFSYLLSSDHKKCGDYWWASILYINNFVPWKATEMCIGQSWYLSNDFQFYILAPIFIVTLFKKPITGVVVSVVTIVASVIGAGVTTYIDKLGPTIADSKLLNSKMMYIKPWIRITPYIIGILGGWIYWRWGEKVRNILSNKPLWLKVVIAVPIWVVTIAIEYAVVFGLYHDVETMSLHPGVAIPEVDSISYEMLARIGWGIALTVQILSCQAGLGGYFNAALSWKGWVFLGKLTYAVYLLHFGLLEILLVNLRHPLFYNSEFEAAFMYTGFLGISYAAGAILFIFVEQPLAYLEAISYRKQK